MRNPFIYGEAVTGKELCDREQEIKELKRDMKGCIKIFLISIRGYGKTSLVMEVLSQLRQEDILTLYLNLEGLSSHREFLESYTRAVAYAFESKIERAVKSAKKILPGLGKNRGRTTIFLFCCSFLGLPR